jgi:hypothetical protein
MLIGPLRAAGTAGRSARWPNHELASVLSVRTPSHREHRADLQVVLQVRTDSGTRHARRDAVALQQLGRADTRQLQQLRRADRAGGQHHLARGPHRLCGCAVAHHLDTACTRRGAVMPQQAAHVRAGPHLQVAALAHRAQECLVRIPAPAGALVDLEIADAFVVAAVEIALRRDPGLLRREREGVEHLPRQALPFDAVFATGAAATLVEARRGMPLVGAAPVVFVAQEVRQAPPPTPRVIAECRGPAVVVATLAAHVDHAVDAGAAAQHLAARIAQAASVQARIRIGLEQPIGARVADAVQIAHRDVDPHVGVVAAGFDQQHLLVRIRAQAVGEQASGGASTNHDVVEARRIRWCVWHQVVRVDGAASAPHFERAIARQKTPDARCGFARSRGDGGDWDLC